jgi:hypothetical protein
MFAHDRGAAASDLSRWLGPLSPAFAALTAAGDPGDAERSAGGQAPAASVPAASPRDREQLVSGAQEGGGQGQAARDAETAELRRLFHTLNNQLGVILTYAELLEAKAPDEALRARAAQIVTAAIDALATTKHLRRHTVG